MNPKICQLLNHLRNNSRQKLTIISKETKIPISTLFDMLNEVQGDLITKSTILLDYEKLGYHARAQVFLRVAQKDKDKLRKHLGFCGNVNSVYKVNNGWDFIMETVHKNIRELDRFLEGLSKDYEIENKEIHYLVEEVKKEEFRFK